MAVMNPKDFINTVFIHQTGELVQTHPYIAFIVMGIGIEYLGKCLNIASDDWNEERVSRTRFEEAINNLPPLHPYIDLVGKTNKFDLYSSLRCGLAHSAAPKFEITLSSKEEMKHLLTHSNGDRVNLRCEDFYTDFKVACEIIINSHYADTDKMNKPFLSVPDYPIDPSQMPVTQSLST